jgi:ABC-type nitrate/sulfonate/bicarbonate transport system, permease component
MEKVMLPGPSSAVASVWENGMLPIIGIASLILLWAAIAQSGWVPESFLPGPFTVIHEIWVLSREPYAGSLIQEHLLASLQKFSAAFALGAGIGVPLGLVMGRFRAVDYVVGPIFDALRFIPPIAWVPFSILWLGTGFMAPVMVIFAGVFSSCVVNAYAGVKQTDPALLEAAQVLGVSRLATVTDVLLPAALPQIVAGLRIGAGFGWQSLIGAELIVGSTGLGYMIIQGESNMTAKVVIAGMIVIGVVGAVIDFVMRRMEKHIRSRWAK